MGKPTLIEEMLRGGRRASVNKIDHAWRTQVRYCGLPVKISWHRTWAAALDAALRAVGL